MARTSPFHVWKITRANESTHGQSDFATAQSQKGQASIDAHYDSFAVHLFLML